MMLSQARQNIRRTRIVNVVALAGVFILSVTTSSLQPPSACQHVFQPLVPAAAREDSALLPRCWGMLGTTIEHLADERQLGVRARLFEVRWREYAPSEGVVNTTYIERMQRELAQFHHLGFDVILSFGFHDTPAWVHTNYNDTYYINQFGERYLGDAPLDNGDANLIFNPLLRGLVETYIRAIFTTFGTDFVAVRLGGGHWGELTYPLAIPPIHANSYWAYDRNALAQSPTPQWRPGEPSPHYEAATFLNWYLNKLVEFQNWQISAVRKHYAGSILMLYPSWGIRPGDSERAIAVDLDGTTAAERNNEVQRGYDFARQIAALYDPLVVVTTTWLDADASQDSSADPRLWSPVKYLAWVVHQRVQPLRMYGENTGRGTAATLDVALAQVCRYNLVGMFWYRSEELWSGQYGSPEEYQNALEQFQPRCQAISATIH